MGAQPTKVQASLGQLRGTPVQVYSKSEGRWIDAVIGAPKDVREPPPDTSAVLVLFKEIVGGRSDAFKWVKSDDIPQLIRARPESKRQAGMMDSMASVNFGTQYDGSSYAQRPTAEPEKQVMSTKPNGNVAMMATMPNGNNAMASFGPMGSVPAERPESAGVMSSLMASVGLAPASSMGSFASTIDQNGSRFASRPDPHHMHTAVTAVPEESPGLFASFMGTPTHPQQHYNPEASSNGFMKSFMETQPQNYDPNVHRPLSMDSAPQSQAGSFPSQQGGLMASLMGMGGSVPASLMGSTTGSAASMTSMVDRGENRSPNRTPMSSISGKPMVTTVPEPETTPGFMSTLVFGAPPQTKVGNVTASRHCARF